MKDYGDILEADRPISIGRAPMTRADRAAQFSPFAALTGYEAAVQETARYTDLQIEQPHISYAEPRNEWALATVIAAVLAAAAGVLIVIFIRKNKSAKGN